MLIAFVDESGSVPLACYLLGAVILDDLYLDDARDVMRSFRVDADKLHWHSEGPERRRAIAEAISKFDHLSIVAVGRGAGRKQERARHKCFELLLPELEQYGVERAVFETRGAKADRTDRLKVAACVGRRLLTGVLQVEFCDPRTEPFLWVADAVCGALYAEEAGDSTYSDILRERLLTIELDVE